jgi:hypothetical protein
MPLCILHKFHLYVNVFYIYNFIFELHNSLMGWTKANLFRHIQHAIFCLSYKEKMDFIQENFK